MYGIRLIPNKESKVDYEGMSRSMPKNGPARRGNQGIESDWVDLQLLVSTSGGGPKANIGLSMSEQIGCVICMYNGWSISRCSPVLLGCFFRALVRCSRICHFLHARQSCCTDYLLTLVIIGASLRGAKQPRRLREALQLASLPIASLQSGTDM